MSKTMAPQAQLKELEGMIDDALIAADDALHKVRKDVLPIKYLSPTNTETAKQAFLERGDSPEFTYRDLEYDPVETEESLMSLEIPSGELGSLLEEKRHELLLQNQLVAHRGDEERVREIAVELYGTPSSELVGHALQLLDTLDVEEEVLTKTPEEMRKGLEEAAREYGLDLLVDHLETIRNQLSAEDYALVEDYTKNRNRRDFYIFEKKVKEEGRDDIADVLESYWVVGRANKSRISTSAARRTLLVPSKNRMFSEQDLEQLAVHEVGVHALRGENGYRQPLKIFATGLANYLFTEEGLTTFLEEATGNSSSQVMRRYAGRVIAVDSMLSGDDFSTTYDRLQSHDFTDEQAWDITVGAHRGGGFAKDHVYLQGFLEVSDFVEQGGDLKKLYVGKVGIENLPLVEELLEKGVLKEPHYVPPFLE